MAQNDIEVFDSPHGGHSRVRHYQQAVTTIRRGEPVRLANTGQVTEPADDPDSTGVLGIALDPVADVQGSRAINNPRTGAAWAANDVIGVIIPDPTTYFVTQNFSNGGAAFGDATPALADIGDEVGLALISGVWGLDQAATNNVCRITDVLDANKVSVSDGGGTGVWVVFQIVAHQSMPVTGVAEAPAAP